MSQAGTDDDVLPTIAAASASPAPSSDRAVGILCRGSPPPPVNVYSRASIGRLVIGRRALAP